ncbi:alpha/beta fold hydrolase [Sphingomonas canadensis]|uniref:Alpha/beta fold hydrolase n=1 Tax=Sphingomonas canadensis TaxID=1219257 RepID=A0ABW3HAK5_9SPHN|nr:alpha/beta hydrolase [Sphingomonas canadensis]MCW3838152.1 alpha/beta hydrolase [Sphingomonas canadensis]
MTTSRRELLRGSLLGGLGFAGAMVALDDAAAAQAPRAPVPQVPGTSLRRAKLNGIDIGYAVAGRGPAMLLLHGWPFTWYTWHKIIPVLAEAFTVIAPDMRGMGETSKAASGYDVVTLSEDVAAILAHEGFKNANILGHDLGVGVAFQLAMRHPQLVRRLVVTESIVLGAPKAEIFMNTPPWWVAWHNVPGLPEQVLAGKEGAYLDWFYSNLTFGNVGIGKAARDQHVAAYTGIAALRGGFEHYRAFPATTEQGRHASQRRLTMPVLALGGELVGDVLYQQMAVLGDQVSGGKIDKCGHIIQEERPDALLERLRAFL